MDGILHWLGGVIPRIEGLLPFVPPPWNKIIAYGIVIAIVVSLLTFLMKLWQQVKPKPKVEEIRSVKGKHARSVKKDAATAERAGNWLAAAESYRSLGNSRKALDMYKKAGAMDRAGELLLNEGKEADALAMWEGSGHYSMAAKRLAKSGQYERAGADFAKANNLSQAGECYEKAGNCGKAGEFFAKAGFNLKAASNFAKAGATLKAAVAYEKYFQEQLVHLGGNITLDREKGVRDLAKRSGAMYEQVGKFKEAAEIYVKGKFHLEAAQTFEKLGENDRASRLYEEAGRPEDAARMLGDASDSRAMSIKAEAFLAQGKIRLAAKTFAEAGDYHQAAELLAKEGQKLEAAKMLLQAGSYLDAAHLFVQGGDKANAAKAFEGARDYESALKIYRETGNAEGYVRALIKADRKIEAASQLSRMKRAREAYQLLQEITPDDEGYDQACIMMARMNSTAGRLDTAIQVIQKGIRGEGVSSNNLDLYYALGRLFEQRRDYHLAQDIYSKILSENIGYKDVTLRHGNIRDQMQHTAPAASSGEQTMILPHQAGSATRNPRYKIIEELGRGGMGVVYKAVDTALDRNVAYKVLPPDMKNHPKVVESFSKEAKALAQMQHPNIVMVFDAGGMGGEFYVVMEYIEGRNLKDVLRNQGQFPIEEAARIFTQLAEALDYAHNRKIAHRDIKTSNVMMATDGNVKLMDFGLAKVMGEAAAQRTAVSGTPYYMSPEQTLGEGVDHRTDIYSLGVMMYELLAGQVPFKQGDIGYHHLHTDPPPPRSLRPDIPKNLEAIIMKCLKKKKEERYQTAADILRDLRV